MKTKMFTARMDEGIKAQLEELSNETGQSQREIVEFALVRTFGFSKKLDSHVLPSENMSIPAQQTKVYCCK